MANVCPVCNNPVGPEDSACPHCGFKLQGSTQRFAPLQFGEDQLVAAAKTGRTVNIKKAQFLSGADMLYPYEKARDAGASEIWLTERGNIYGYNNLVVDFRNIAEMLRIAPTVVMDCTHSVQRPGAAGGKTGGNREFVPAMAQAAKAFGANGFFFEVHPDPDHAKSDGPNMLQLDELENLIKTLL